MIQYNEATKLSLVALRVCLFFSSFCGYDLKKVSLKKM